jgi:hypothetical protein
MADDKIRYVLDVDDKGTPKLVKFGAAAEKSSKQASKGFDGASKSVSDFAQQIPGLGGAMSAFSGGPAMATGAALAAVGVGFVALTKRSIDTADKFNDLSLRLGISTERLSVLSLYAEQSGTDIDTLATAMGKLGVKLSAGDKTLKSYGITAGSVDEALFQLADKIAATTDPMLRLKMATDAFGKSGQNMLPLLVQGGDALRTMSKEAPIVSTELAKMADQFNDKWAVFQGKFTELGFGLAEKIIPSLESMVDLALQFTAAMSGGAKGSETMGNAWEQRAGEIRKELDDPTLSKLRRVNLEAKLRDAEGRSRAFQQDAFASAQSSMSGPGGMGGFRGETAPVAPGAFGAGMVQGVPQFADAFDANQQFLDNKASLARFNAAKAEELASGPQGESVELGPDWFAGIPLSDKAKESIAKQEDEAAAEEDRIRAEQVARNKSAMQAIAADMKGAFASAYTDIWTNGRDAFSALYDAFSEQFTTRVIDSLASLSANGLMALLSGGASAPAGGILGLLGFAGGGNPPEGSPVMVGERRAEMFIPRGPGRIDPTAGAGQTINITVSNVAQAATLKRRLEREDRRGNRGVR